MFEDFSIGQKIATERKKQSKTIAQISKDLRIQESYLKSIEKDDYSLLPGKAYISGFIKSYAEYLGLDHEDLLKMLKATQDLQEDYHNMPQEIRGNKRTQKKLFYISLGSIIFIAMCFNYYVQLKHEISLRKIEEKTNRTETLAQFFDKTQNHSIVRADSKINSLLNTTESIPETEDEKIRKTKEMKMAEISLEQKKIAARLKVSASQIEETKASWKDLSLEGIQLHYQKSKPPFSRVLLKANKDVWFQIRPLNKKRIYVSRVLPKGKYYWVTPWNNVVLDVSDPSAMEIIVDNKLLGSLGTNAKRIRGAFLDASSMQDYFIYGENKNNDKIENY